LAEEEARVRFFDDARFIELTALGPEAPPVHLPARIEPEAA
jgi:hypothetical protein